MLNRLKKFVRSNLVEFALVSSVGTVFGLVFGSRAMVVVGVALASGVILLAKKVKDGDLDRVVDKYGLDEAKRNLSKFDDELDKFDK